MLQIIGPRLKIKFKSNTDQVHNKNVEILFSFKSLHGHTELWRSFTLFFCSVACATIIIIIVIIITRTKKNQNHSAFLKTNVLTFHKWGLSSKTMTKGRSKFEVWHACINKSYVSLQPGHKQNSNLVLVKLVKHARNDDVHASQMAVEKDR